MFDDVTDLERAVDLAFLHQVPPRDPIFASTIRALTAVDILCEIELDEAKCDPFTSTSTRVLLQDLKVYPSLLQHLVLSYDQPNGESLFVVIHDLVVLDIAFRTLSAVLRCCGRRQMPFDERGT